MSSGGGGGGEGGGGGVFHCESPKSGHGARGFIVEVKGSLLGRSRARCGRFGPCFIGFRHSFHLLNEVNESVDKRPLRFSV